MTEGIEDEARIQSGGPYKGARWRRRSGKDDLVRLPTPAFQLVCVQTDSILIIELNSFLPYVHKPDTGKRETRQVYKAGVKVDQASREKKER